MVQDAIAKITEAEEQAEVLCRVAAERAAEARADMERKAKAHLEDVERQMAEQTKQKLAVSRMQTDALIEKKRAEAVAEAEELTKKAQERLDEAVKMIVWGIVEKCQ